MSNYPDDVHPNDPRAPWNQPDPVDCPDCDGSGELPHDCGEDTCCCLYPETEMCETCEGEGHYWPEESEPEWEPDDYV